MITRENALEVDAILNSVIRYGTAKIIKGFPRPAFGKTGHDVGFVDAWFVGSTPQLAAAVWVGYVKHPTPMLTQYNGTPVFGGTLPAIAWSQFEQKALAGQPVLSFESAVAAERGVGAHRHGKRPAREPVVPPCPQRGDRARQGAERLLPLQRHHRHDARPAAACTPRTRAA